MLTLPLIDHKDILVGVMQVLNKKGGIFDEDDEAVATALAAQCAVALQRVRMTGALIEGEKMRQALEMAREVQMSTLPSTMPVVPGYDVCGSFRPAELTGGDTFDLSVLDGELLVVLADATGHGIAPALSVTQMQAMLRIAFQLGANLQSARSSRSTTVSRPRSRPTASSPPSSGCWIRRRIACSFTAAARRRSCITGLRSERACRTCRRAFRWGRCRLPS